MVPYSNDLAELQGLLDLLCEERIDTDQFNRLQQWIAEREDALQYYRSYAKFHALLRCTVGGVERALLAKTDPSPQGPAGSELVPHPDSKSAAAAVPAALLELTATWLTSAKALAITVVAGLLTYFVVLVVSLAISRSAGVNQNSHLPGSVANAPARIIGSRAARWQDPARRLDAGTGLLPGVSRLAAGVIEIEFGHGALVTIEGPAEFVPLTDSQIRLMQGKLVALVPKAARGFRVETPAADLVDLGTEFGVEVDRLGDTALHVLRGRVEVSSVSGATAKGNRPTKVIAGEAVRIAVAGGAATQIPIEQDRFSFVRGSAGRITVPVAGETVAAANFPPIWLGNLFDDAKGTRLSDALATDTYQASPTESNLGIERVIQAAGRPTKPGQPDWVANRVAPDGLLDIAPHIAFDLQGLGWSGMVHGNVANDASSKFATYQSGGLRTRGEPIATSAPRIEEGIGMHADSLLTFDLDEIRAAGQLVDRPLEFVCDRVGVNDDDPAGIRHRASLHVAVLVSDAKRVQTAVVNGTPVPVAESDGVWTLETLPGEPLRADGRFVPYRVPIPATAKYLTLVASSADGDNDMDHAAWSGARLEVVGRQSAEPQR